MISTFSIRLLTGPGSIAHIVAMEMGIAYYSA